MELFKHVAGHDAAGTSNRIMSFIPSAVSVEVMQDMKEIAFLEGELLRDRRLVRLEGPNDLLGRNDEACGFGDWGKRRRDGDMVGVVLGAIKGFA